MREKTVPRGIRNNNPMNIRKTDTFWVGQKRDQKDASFVEFDSPKYGYRAAAKILKSYARRGIVTLEQIVKTWAPHNENPTDAYVVFVSNKTGFSKDKTIKYENDLASLFHAMTVFENGYSPFSHDQIVKGIRLA